MTTTIEDHGVAGAIVQGYVPGNTIGELHLEPGQYALTVETDSLAVLYGSIEELSGFVTRLEALIPQMLAHRVQAEEDARRALVEAMPEELQGVVAAGEPYWTTEQMRELFTVEGFAAPWVLVRRKSDGQPGTLTFTHSPRYYFDFKPSS